MPTAVGILAHVLPATHWLVSFMIGSPIGVLAVVFLILAVGVVVNTAAHETWLHKKTTKNEIEISLEEGHVDETFEGSVPTAVLLVRLTSLFAHPISVTDVRLEITTTGEQVHAGKSGNVAEWILVKDVIEKTAFSSINRNTKYIYLSKETILLDTLAAEPLQFGVIRSGWIAFSFPELANLSTATIESYRIMATDAVRGEHVLFSSTPWTQSGKLVHVDWYGKYGH